MELKDLLAVAWKRRVAVLAVFGLTMLFAALFAFSQPKRYESTATLAMTPDVKQGQGLFAADNLSALLGTYAETAKSTITLRRAERTLGRDAERRHRRLDRGRHRHPAHQRDARPIRRTRPPPPPRSPPRSRTRSPTARCSTPRSSIRRSPSSTPVQPRPPLILLVAALLGGFAGVLLAFAPGELPPPDRDARRHRRAHPGPGHRPAPPPAPAVAGRARRSSGTRTTSSACRRATARCAPTSSSCSRTARACSRSRARTRRRASRRWSPTSPSPSGRSASRP